MKPYFQISPKHLAWIFFIGFIWELIFLPHPSIAADTNSCPETLLFDFKKPVPSREAAQHIFAEFFSSEKGYPAFESEKIRGPYLNDPSVPPGSFSYFGWYGEGQSKVGGLLYPDGRLVQRGYCK